MSMTTKLVAALALFSSALAISGHATPYYGGGQGGACSFDTYDLPEGIYAASSTDSTWKNSQACGGCIKVTGPNGKSVTAMIVNQCNQCGANNIALETTGYEKISTAKNPPGQIAVQWENVNCPITTPLYISSSAGSGQYYYAAQVLNGTQSTAAMSASTDGGVTWQKLQRQNYNYFILSSGFHAEAATFKLTGTGGKMLTINAVPAAGGSQTFAKGNY